LPCGRIDEQPQWAWRRWCGILLDAQLLIERLSRQFRGSAGVPIEFRCTNCERLLRTPDGTSGRDAKCPQCGTIVKIPLVPAAPPITDPHPSTGSREIGTFVESPENVHRFEPTAIELGEILSRSWEIFKVQWPACLAAVWGTTAILALYFAMLAIAVLGNLAATQRKPGPELLIVLPLLLPAIWWQVVALHAFLLKVARGQRATAGDLFAVGDFLIPAFGSTCLAALAVFAGSLLCIVPGVILFLMLSQCLNIVIDQRAGVIDSLRLSMRATQGNKVTLLLLMLVNSSIASIAGTLTCLLAGIIVQPFTMLAMCVAYLVMTGQATAVRPRVESERRFG
jgi:phage FluMu protein Com